MPHGDGVAEGISCDFEGSSQFCEHSMRHIPGFGIVTQNVPISSRQHPRFAILGWCAVIECRTHDFQFWVLVVHHLDRTVALVENRSPCSRACESFMLATFMARTALVSPVDPRYRSPRTVKSNQ